MNYDVVLVGGKWADVESGWDIHGTYPTVPLMQYTGLKDKNGKEIYEGDVVKCSSGCEHQVVWYEDVGGTYFGGMPGWNLSGLDRNGGKGYAWAGTEEVIGNIYENPDLLTKTV
jgi:hypothetical protein